MFMNLQALDGGILLWLQSVRQPLLDGILTLYTQLGNAGVAWIVLSVVLLFFRRTRKGGALALCAMLFGLIGTNLVLKNLFQRMRPYEVVEGLTHLVHITDPNSFPSGHTCASLAAACALYHTLPRKWGVACIVLAVLISLSRLYVGVHYPSDVLGGAVVGIFAGWTCWKLQEILRNRKGRKEEKQAAD